jgi:hypothetical protein
LFLSPSPHSQCGRLAAAPSHGADLFAYIRLARFFRFLS